MFSTAHWTVAVSSVPLFYVYSFGFTVKYLVNFLCHSVTCGSVKCDSDDLCKSLFNDIIDSHGYQLLGLGKSRTALNEITSAFKMNETLYHGYI